MTSRDALALQRFPEYWKCTVSLFSKGVFLLHYRERITKKKATSAELVSLEVFQEFLFLSILQASCPWEVPKPAVRGSIMLAKSIAGLLGYS